MNRALEKIKKLPEAKFFDLKALFISCDPDRDSPEKIKRFLSY
jgi:cytochrome oxidase Cu insertion factor (SCO1/SenC/PrrC family)